MTSLKNQPQLLQRSEAHIKKYFFMFTRHVRKSSSFSGFLKRNCEIAIIMRMSRTLKVRENEVLVSTSLMSTRSICAIVWNFLNIAQKCCRRISWLRNWSVQRRQNFEALLFFQVSVGSPSNFNFLTRRENFISTAFLSLQNITSATIFISSYPWQSGCFCVSS